MSDDKLKQVFLYLPVSVLEKDRVLNNGHKYPMITFGISKIEGFENVYNAVDVALQTGYRSFDCGPTNRQEENLGEALYELLPKYKLTRKDILITSRVLSKNYGMESTSEAFWRSCEKLKTNYLDLYLLQWPGGDNMDPEDEENELLRVETWKECTKLFHEGFIRNAGVCNFEVKHLESLRDCAYMTPCINQVEFHPRFPQVELLDYCKDHKILLQAMSFKNTCHPLVMGDSTVRTVAKEMKKTPAQVVLKWIINKGVAVICQSENYKKIKENFKLYDFVLEKPEMDALNSIRIRQKYFWNPIQVS